MGREKKSPKLTSIRKVIEVERVATSLCKFIHFVSIPCSSCSGLNILPLEKLQQRAVRWVQSTKNFFFSLEKNCLSRNMLEIHKMSGILKNETENTLPFFFRLKIKKAPSYVITVRINNRK